MTKPKILICDIETAPILASVWGLWDQTVGLNQIKTDWHLLSFGAKWLGEKEVQYYDQRGAKDVTADKQLLQKLWKLLDECDILLGQNSQGFDHKKINARFALNGMKPPSSYRHIDTMKIAKKYFAFTSNKLEYLSEKLCKKYKKHTKRKFAGFELWKECLLGNRAAWNEMKAYNIIDVLATEELYLTLRPWDGSINFGVYNDRLEPTCACGSSEFVKNGFCYSQSGKFQRMQCRSCGAEIRTKENLLGADKRKSLGTGVKR